MCRYTVRTGCSNRHVRCPAHCIGTGYVKCSAMPALRLPTLLYEAGSYQPRHLCSTQNSVNECTDYMCDFMKLFRHAPMPRHTLVAAASLAGVDGDRLDGTLRDIQRVVAGRIEQAELPRGHGEPVVQALQQAPAGPQDHLRGVALDAGQDLARACRLSQHAAAYG